MHDEPMTVAEWDALVQRITEADSPLVAIDGDLESGYVILKADGPIAQRIRAALVRLQELEVGEVSSPAASNNPTAPPGWPPPSRYEIYP